MNPKTFYITTAIDYVNSRPHLGTAYEKIAADVIARYHRLIGDEVLFVMGNDEHSLKIEIAARAQGLEPLAYCDRMETVFREAWAALDVVFDDFIRTTEARHRRAVQEILTKLKDRGDVYRGSYEGWYCNGCEAFKNEGDLVDGRCPEHLGTEPTWLRESNWFFRLSAYADRLQDHYAAHPDFVEPEIRRNEMLGVLEDGLKDISISRESAHWGVPVPFDEGAVVYVWFDALVNYLSATGWPEDAERSRKWWPADLHLVGKDITRFHCLIWPAMLAAADLPLPRKVFGHGFVNLGKDRMSKSLGTTVEPKALAATYGPDAIRWYLMAEASFGRDVEYGEDRLVIRTNADLANGLGNLCSRSVSMLIKYRDGRVPEPPHDSTMRPVIDEARRRYREAMDRLDLKSGADAAMSIVTRANVLVDEEAPWALAKDPAQGARLERVLYDLIESCRAASILLHPFMPRKMNELRALLGEAAAGGATGNPAFESSAFGGLPAGRVLAKPSPLFLRIEQKERNDG